MGILALLYGAILELKMSAGGCDVDSRYLDCDSLSIIGLLVCIGV